MVQPVMVFRMNVDAVMIIHSKQSNNYDDDDDDDEYKVIMLVVVSLECANTGRPTICTQTVSSSD